MDIAAIWQDAAILLHFSLFFYTLLPLYFNTSAISMYYIKTIRLFNALLHGISYSQSATTR